jgi:hypothetical protein
MKLRRRQFVQLAAGSTALLAVPRFARAQTYPTRPIRLVVPFRRAAHLTPSGTPGRRK